MKQPWNISSHYKINTKKQMQKVKDKSNLYRKYTPTMSHQPTYMRSDSYEPSQCNTVQSAYSNVGKLKQTIQGPSSRIADQVQPFDSQYDQFRSQILKKVVCIEEEANTILEKKQRQLYFLKIQLQNNEVRLLQAEQVIIKKDREIQMLKHQIDRDSRGQIKGRSKEQNSSLVEQNLKLKQSLKKLIGQKNQNWRQPPYDNYAHHNQPYVDRLKKEVEQLRVMVAEMQQMVHNCPSCFTFSRNLQELNESYACLLKEHTKLQHLNQTQEHHHLKNITKQIQENQNVVRENNHLRGERVSKYYLRPKREKLNESVAKRCRTLTDQF